MSVPYQRISVATVKDIQIYDPAAERRAESTDVNWDVYFKIGSQEILYQLEWSWWPSYVENTSAGATYFTNNPRGQLISGFNPDLLIKTDQTLVRLDVFRAVLEFYSTLVTDVSNVNEVDKNNYLFSKERYEHEWDKAMKLSNFYDIGRDGFVDKLEENYNADVNYFTGDRRYF